MHRHTVWLAGLVMKMEAFCTRVQEMNCSYSRGEMRAKKMWMLKDTDTPVWGLPA